MLRFKIAAKKRIFLSQKQSHDQNLKNHFPNGISNEIWLKVEKTWIEYI